MRALAVPIIVLFLAGCSSTATIYLKDGSIATGTIERGDSSLVYVVGCRKKAIDGSKGMKRKLPAKSYRCSPRESRDIAILREDITDISHPGKMQIAGGITIALIGGAGAAVMFVESESGLKGEAQSALRPVAILSLVVAVVGAAISYRGFATLLSSRSAAALPEETATIKITPVAITDGERTYLGLGMTWSI